MRLKVHVTDVPANEYRIDDELNAQDGVVGELPVEVIGNYLEALDAFREARRMMSEALEATGLTTGTSSSP